MSSFLISHPDQTLRTTAGPPAHGARFGRLPQQRPRISGAMASERIFTKASRKFPGDYSYQSGFRLVSWRCWCGRGKAVRNRSFCAQSKRFLTGVPLLMERHKCPMCPFQAINTPLEKEAPLLKKWNPCVPQATGDLKGSRPDR